MKIGALLRWLLINDPASLSLTGRRGYLIPYRPMSAAPSPGCPSRRKIRRWPILTAKNRPISNAELIPLCAGKYRLKSHFARIALEFDSNRYKALKTYTHNGERRPTWKFMQNFGGNNGARRMELRRTYRITYPHGRRTAENYGSNLRNLYGGDRIVRIMNSADRAISDALPIRAI